MRILRFVMLGLASILVYTGVMSGQCFSVSPNIQTYVTADSDGTYIYMPQLKSRDIQI
jgi:hypothetical protein